MLPHFFDQQNEKLDVWLDLDCQKIFNQVNTAVQKRPLAIKILRNSKYVALDQQQKWLLISSNPKSEEIFEWLKFGVKKRDDSSAEWISYKLPQANGRYEIYSLAKK